jgi:hypothetical protein
MYFNDIDPASLIDAQSEVDDAIAQYEEENFFGFSEQAVRAVSTLP